MITKHFTTSTPRLMWLANGPATPNLSALTMLFVHGAAHQAEIFLPWLNELERQGVTAYAMSLRGHGESEVVSGELLNATTVEQYAEDIRAVVQSVPNLASGHFVLAAHSLGSLPAEAYAHVNPPAGLLLLGAPAARDFLTIFGAFMMRHPLAALSALRDRSGQNNAIFNSPDRVRRFLLAPGATPEQVDFVFAQLTAETDLNLVTAYAKRAQKRQPPAVQSVMAMAGHHDAIFIADTSHPERSKLARSVHDAYNIDLSVLDGAGHDLMVADNAVTAEAVARIVTFAQASLRTRVHS